MTQLHDPGTTVEMTIPVNRLVHCDNYREGYPDDHIRDLAKSIRADGQRDPLLVELLDGGLARVLSGNCRMEALLLLTAEGWQGEARCIVVHPRSDEERAWIVIDMNHRRRDPDDVETGNGYRGMMNDHGWTVAQLSDRFGKPPRYVLNRLAVASLGSLLRDAFRAKGFGLTVAQVIADADLTEGEQTGLWRMLQTCPAITPEVTAELCDKFLAARDVQDGLFGGDWSEADTTNMFPDWTPPAEPALPGRDVPPEFPGDGAEVLLAQAEWWQEQATRWTNHFNKPVNADRCRAAAAALAGAAEKVGQEGSALLLTFAKALTRQGVDKHLLMQVLQTL